MSEPACDRCKAPEGITWRVMGRGRTWNLCSRCRPAWRVWFTAGLPRARRWLADYGVRDE